MVKEIEENQEKKGKSFLWFLYVVLIPLLFAVTVSIIVFTIAGVDVIDSAKNIGQKIPVIGSLVQKEHSNTSKSSGKDVIELQGQLKDREAEISQLQTQIDSRNKDIQRAELENSRLQKEIDDMAANEAESKLALKDIIKTYETMSAKKAAPIITQMNDKEALKILSSLKADNLAAIMENMSSTDAAKYTQFLTNGSNNN